MLYILSLTLYISVQKGQTFVSWEKYWAETWIYFFPSVQDYTLPVVPVYKYQDVTGRNLASQKSR